jgi:hypothetical protein
MSDNFKINLSLIHTQFQETMESMLTKISTMLAQSCIGSTRRLSKIIFVASSSSFVTTQVVHRDACFKTRKCNIFLRTPHACHPSERNSCHLVFLTFRRESDAKLESANHPHSKCSLTISLPTTFHCIHQERPLTYQNSSIPKYLRNLQWLLQNWNLDQDLSCTNLSN